MPANAISVGQKDRGFSDADLDSAIEALGGLVVSAVAGVYARPDLTLLSARVVNVAMYLRKSFSSDEAPSSFQETDRSDIAYLAARYAPDHVDGLLEHLPSGAIMPGYTLTQWYGREPVYGLIAALNEAEGEDTCTVLKEAESKKDGGADIGALTECIAYDGLTCARLLRVKHLSQRERVDIEREAQGQEDTTQWAYEVDTTNMLNFSGEAVRVAKELGIYKAGTIEGPKLVVGGELARLEKFQGALENALKTSDYQDLHSTTVEACTLYSRVEGLKTFSKD